MKQQTFARIAAGAVAVLLVLAGASIAAAVEDIQFTDTKTFNAGTSPEFDISNLSGDIWIREL